jgi:hypothetical protein
MAIISNAVTIADAGAFSVSLGSKVHIKTLTASSSATLSFVHGTDGVVLDSTYPIYKFEFINIHPANDRTEFLFNMSTDSGSNYNVTKTTTFFRAQHREDDTVAELAYDAGLDLAQSTSFQQLSFEMGNGDDDNSNGTLELFNPSSTTFVKHFIARASFNHNVADPRAMNSYIAGYGNTTSAVNAIRFQMSGSSNIDSGKIKLYGIKDS